MKIYSILIIFSSLFLTSCFTIPGKDRIVTVDSYINEDISCIRPLSRPIDTVEYIPADQSLRSKINYINQCMINYSWGRGWNNKTDQDFQN